MPVCSAIQLLKLYYSILLLRARITVCCSCAYGASDEAIILASGIVAWYPDQCNVYGFCLAGFS
jgi:hypothetical protein